MSTALDKVRKLLRIAADNAASEHEIELCLAKADRLMQEHHLSEADLIDDFAAIRDAALNGRFMKRTVHAARKCYAWEHQLSVFLKKYIGGLGCYSESGVEHDAEGRPYRDRKGMPFTATVIIFFGLQDDIELAECLFADLRQAIISLAVRKHRGCFRGPGASYAQGFVAGLFTQMKQRREAERVQSVTLTDDRNPSQELSVIQRRDELVRLKEQTAYEWLASPTGGGIQLCNHTSRGSAASREAWLQGRTDGARHQVSGQIAPRLGLTNR